jgi:hypothetical protein
MQVIDVKTLPESEAGFHPFMSSSVRSDEASKRDT